MLPVVPRCYTNNVVDLEQEDRLSGSPSERRGVILEGDDSSPRPVSERSSDWSGTGLNEPL
jgi:hypothetical protein